MAEKAEYSPMMQEYLKTKEEYKDCILFYRLGDFYEMFFEDALTASHELELTLTGKSAGWKMQIDFCKRRKDERNVNRCTDRTECTNETN